MGAVAPRDLRCGRRHGPAPQQALRHDAVEDDAVHARLDVVGRRAARDGDIGYEGQVGAPRGLSVRWPFGHPLGEPGNIPQQTIMIRHALDMLATATERSLHDAASRVASDRMKTRCRDSPPMLQGLMAFIRMRSPSSAPPVFRLEGSTEMIPIVLSLKSSRKRLTISSTMEDFPEPPVPVTPSTGVFTDCAFAVTAFNRFLCLS